LQWFDLPSAYEHCRKGLSVIPWASTDGGENPDIVLACCGDVPTTETLAAAHLLHQHLPDVRVRLVNVVDLMRLQPDSEHPHGLSDDAFDAIFTQDKQVIFAFHGYPSLIHQLIYRRHGHANIHVRGYKEEGTTTTPFDMCVLNDIDRYKLVMDVIDRCPDCGPSALKVRNKMLELRKQHREYILVHGDDPSEIRDWKWSS